MTVKEFCTSLLESNLGESEKTFVLRVFDSMNDLSLLILDIFRNAVEADAENIMIRINESDDAFEVTVSDDGKGMTHELMKLASSTAFTTKSTRSVGLGLPLFSLTAKQTGGSFGIESSTGGVHFTKVSASFKKKSPLCPVLGDMPSALISAINGLDGAELDFKHVTPFGEVTLSTKDIIGDLPKSLFSSADVLMLIKDELISEYEKLKNKNL